MIALKGGMDIVRSTGNGNGTEVGIGIGNRMRT